MGRGADEQVPGATLREYQVPAPLGSLDEHYLSIGLPICHPTMCSCYAESFYFQHWTPLRGGEKV